jgi:hypothetical protein
MTPQLTCCFDSKGICLFHPLEPATGCPSELDPDPAGRQ